MTTTHTEEWIPLTIGSHTYGYIALTGDSSLPAIGGCRILQQAHDAELGLSLSMDLARTMQKKVKAAGLNLSGGKTVLFIEDPKKRPTLLMHYAEALNRLKGRYITAIDIGSSQSDMDFISTVSPYVTCHTAVGGDPSGYTAQTVLQGAMTAYQHLHHTAPQHIVLQGLGKVGLQILELLSKKHPLIQVSATDIQELAIQKAQAQYPQCHIVEADHIYNIPCDIFISAGDSYLITQAIAQTLPSSMLAIAANNAFAHESCETILKARGITVLPDYLINSGGVMCCAHQIGLIKSLDFYLAANQAFVAKYVEETAVVATV